MICTGGEAVPRRLRGNAREGAARKISPNVTCYQRMGKGKTGNIDVENVFCWPSRTMNANVWANEDEPCPSLITFPM